MHSDIDVARLHSAGRYTPSAAGRHSHWPLEDRHEALWWDEVGDGTAMVVSGFWKVPDKRRSGGLIG